MKTNFNIELDLGELWSEDGSFAEEIKYRIREQVKREVLIELSKQIDKELFAPLVEEAKEEMKIQIVKKMERLKNQIRLPKDRRDNKLVSLSEFMNHNLAAGRDDTFKKFLGNQTEKIGKELKERYDSHFANLIVQRLNDNGLLKEGALDILLEK